MRANRNLATVLVVGFQFVPQTSQACKASIDRMRFATAFDYVAIRAAHRADSKTRRRADRSQRFVDFQELGNEIQQVDTPIDERSDVGIKILFGADVLAKRFFDIDFCGPPVRLQAAHARFPLCASECSMHVHAVRDRGNPCADVDAVWVTQREVAREPHRLVELDGFDVRMEKTIDWNLHWRNCYYKNSR